MITFLTVATATTLAEAFGVGAVLGLGVFWTIKYKKAPHSKIKVKWGGSGMVASTTVNRLKDGTKKTIRYCSCGRHKSQGASVCKVNSIRADYAESH